MVNKPSFNLSLIDFIEQFHSEELCIQYLFDLRIGNRYVCSKCKSKRYSFIKTRPHQLFCLDCHHQLSLIKGTLFENSKLSLNKWFLAVLLVARDKRGVSALTLERELQLHRNTTMVMLSELRTLMGKRDAQYKLNGIIEIDEFFIGASGGKAGRGTSKSKVIIALSYQNIPLNEMSNEFISEYEDETSQSFSDNENIEVSLPMYCKMKVVDDLKSDTINQFIIDGIEKGSHIITDEYNGYNKLIDLEITHERKNLDYNDQQYKYLHIAISNLKSFILGTYHGSAEDYLQLFLNEFCYRFNRRKLHESLFDRLLKLAIEN